MKQENLFGSSDVIISVLEEERKMVVADIGAAQKSIDKKKMLMLDLEDRRSRLSEAIAEARKFEKAGKKGKQKESKKESVKVVIQESQVSPKKS